MLSDVKGEAPVSPGGSNASPSPRRDAIVSYVATTPKGKRDMSHTLTVNMLTDQQGSPDGVSCVDYDKGRDYTFRGDQAVDLGRVFIREGWAVEVVPEPEPVAIPEPPEPEEQAAELEEEKQVAAPKTRQLPRPADKAKARGKRKRR